MNPRETLKKLNSLYGAVDAVYLKIASENGLSYNGLMMLYMVEEDEKLTQRKVCDELHLPKSSVHSILSELVRKGLLELTEGGNRKEKYIAATREGQNFIQKISVETDRIEASALEAVSERELVRFLRTADALAGRMTKMAEEVYEGGEQDES